MKNVELNENLVKKEIDKLLPDYIKFLSALVKYNSVYLHEAEVQNFVKSKMKELSLEVNTIYSRADNQSINLVSIILGEDRDNCNSLILNAHCDVTPVDHPELWQHDPFSGIIEDNKLYGRGSQDDKAGIAIILFIVNLLQKMGIKLKGDLIIQSVIEDETTGNGTKCLVDKGYTADGVIIVDGTWSERIIFAHLGQIWLDVDITGSPVPACVESRGVNPIYIAMDFINQIKYFINKIDEDCIFEGIEKPFFVNIGSCNSGIWHGSVPAECKLEIQIGFNDKYTPDEILDHVNNIASSISDRINVTKKLLATPSYKSNPNNLLIRKLKSIIEQNSKKEVKVVSVTGHCDMRHFELRNICLYGPGGGKNAHGTDEHYFLDQMPIVTKNLFEFVLYWCNEKR